MKNLENKYSRDNLIKVAVLMGGPSAEHEVSLATGKMILAAMPKNKYEAFPVLISKKCLWKFSDGEILDEVQAIKKLKNFGGIVFIAMHGEYGEDGTLQKLLEEAKISFTGSGSGPSALGMDKVASSKVFEKGGLLVPDYFVVDRKERSGMAHNSKYPVVVKPADRGSSVGVSICKDEREFLIGIGEAFQLSEKVIVQEFIRGRELTCGVIENENGEAVALPPTEIIPKKGIFFDYKSKYEKGGSDEITPPKCSKEIIRKIQEVALAAHRLIGARGMSRTDMILVDRESSDLFVLEINTIPGMTETSLLPQEAKVAGISFEELLNLIINAGLRTGGRD